MQQEMGLPVGLRLHLCMPKGMPNGYRQNRGRAPDNLYSSEAVPMEGEDNLDFPLMLHIDAHSKCTEDLQERPQAIILLEKRIWQ